MSRSPTGWSLRRTQTLRGSSFSALNQVSYIKDFDVEVAQAATIADPIVGVVNSGAVLDAKVVGIYGTMTTIEKRIISESLEDLTGRAFGPNPAAWMAWWKEEKARGADASSEAPPVPPRTNVPGEAKG